MKITETDRTAIRCVIERQLQAFQNNDAISAFAFATPGIQRQFVSPENFIHMVKTAYPAVYRPRSVLFENLTNMRGALTHTKTGLYNPFFSKPHNLVETFRRNVSTTRTQKGATRADLVSDSAAA